MQININLTDEQQKALLTEYTSIEEYCQRVVENRANRIMMDIVKKYADDLEGVTTEEQAIINNKLAGKIVVRPDKLPEEVKQIIVLAEKIDTLDKNVTGINARLDKLNGRTFKNSTDIAKLKTSNGIIATFISMVVAGVISFIGWKAR